ncbi:McrB family protein [Vreelandella populi]|uniref:McrB family protein n=1 Tax=Vreelandella populi TaxID=2498858 RepID=UPI000F8CA57A|nr:AAA family ATPase [Halomonas populi]RUR36656.1 AAA family ATPase [Halomonas populi]
MQWHDVLTGHAFQSWIFTVASRNIVRIGQPLDPFTTSNRRLIRTSGWLTEIEYAHSLSRLVNKERAEHQALTDLQRAHLITRSDSSGAELSRLGQLVLDCWRRHSIDNDIEQYEVPRALSLVLFAVSLNDELYGSIIDYWHEIRSVYRVNELIADDNALTLLIYINRTENHYNPWKHLYHLRFSISDSNPSDWSQLLNSLMGIDSDLDAAIQNFTQRVADAATRSRGRRDFISALEIASLGQGMCDYFFDAIQLNDSARDVCKDILKEFSPSARIPELGVVEANVLDVLNRRRNVILYGPPGTGKTRTALNVREHWEGINGEGTVFNITFHPSFSYEDFVQGFRPEEDQPGSFILKDGILLTACKKAEKEKENIPNGQGKVLLLIDEINRGDTSRIFGELITYIEADKREVKFSFSNSIQGQLYSIPDNLYILGTMNTADKSVSLMDTAIRRRFAFMGFFPDPAVYDETNSWASEIEGIRVGEILASLNRRLLDTGIEPDRALGHALLGLKSDSDDVKQQLIERLHYDVYPLVSEYCYMNREAIREILGEFVDEFGNFRNLDNEGLIEALKSLIEN